MITSSDRQQFRELVAEVATRAKGILPQETNGRVESAVKLVLMGDVEPQADGTVTVFSATDATRRYVLQGQTCTCADYERGQAPEGWCQHRIAAGIDKRTREMLAAQAADITLSDGTAAPQAPLPEAPASVNVRVLVGGHEVQWTLRDVDEGRLAERLQALLKRPDIRPVPKPAPRSQQWRKGGQHG